VNKNIFAGLASGVALGVVLGLILGRTPGGAWWRIEGWPSPDEWQAFGAIAALFVAVSAVLYAGHSGPPIEHGTAGLFEHKELRSDVSSRHHRAFS
jgi:hypothetical protein